MGVVVAVDDPFEKVVPGQRPPLSKGMFVEVVLSAEPQRPMVVLPRAAVRDGRVLLADADDRLQRRPVEVAFSQDGVSALAAGVEPGERVVLSDLTPAVSGMRLRPEVDAAAAARLEALATGGRDGDAAAP
jgi:hypothetical protein